MSHKEKAIAKMMKKGVDKKKGKIKGIEKAIKKCK